MTARETARAIYLDALGRLRADRLLRQFVSREPGLLRWAGGAVPLPKGRVIVIAAGKASAAMGQAMESMLDDRRVEGIVVVKPGHELALSRLATCIGGHPLPDEGSLAAGRMAADLAERAGPDDLVLVLLSGGASALMEDLLPGWTLPQLRELTGVMLRSGAPIQDINRVRCAVSRLKAGGLARLAQPAQMAVFVLSDVVGDPLAVIGSGPCVAPTDTRPLSAILERWGITATVRQPPSVEVPAVRHGIIGNRITALAALSDSAKAHGFCVHVCDRFLDGPVNELVDDPQWPGNAVLEPGEVALAGGEPTVVVRGRGLGGRCQELAAMMIPRLADRKGHALLCGSTDGTDGPTGAAGAIIDESSAHKVREAGADLGECLAANDSTRVHSQTGDLVVTGPTQSNLNDLFMLLRMPESGHL